jgi:hypothetical protein
VAGSAGGNPTLGEYRWQLGTLVQKWIDGSYANNGILLKKTDESVVSVPEFNSLDATSGASPTMWITYQARLGHRSHWVYTNYKIHDRKRRRRQRQQRQPHGLGQRHIAARREWAWARAHAHSRGGYVNVRPAC